MVLCGLTLVWGPHMRRFIEELRHRNVFRVGIAYVIAAWLFVQAADIATESFAAPEWVMRTLIIFLLVGLPVALFLAWAFELTPDGVKKAADVPEGAAKDPRSGQRLNRITLLALIVAVAWIGWDAAKDQSVVEPEVVTATSDKSIAVLPFGDFSPDGDQAWFADGLAEEILNSLARITDLHVASRTSSFAFRDSTGSIPEIASELGVAHILEGSVRRAGNQLRVTAQLIRAADDKHLWSDTFDGSVDNSIAIQEEVAIQIANALQTAMDPAELERMIAAGTSSVEAWELYLRALALQGDVSNSGDRGAIFDVVDLLDKAVTIDPSFIDAHLQLANLLYFQLEITTTYYSEEGPPYAARRARFDSALGSAINLARSEVDRTRAEIQKADVEVRIADQIRLTERLTALSPDDPLAWIALLELYQLAGQPEKALEAARKGWAVRTPGTFVEGFLIEMRRLDVDEAVRMVDAYVAEDISSSNFYYQAHRALLDAGQVERATPMIDAFTLRSVDELSTLMMRVRQACAEDRIDDAEALVQGGPASNMSWLALKTVGRDVEARELLRQYETPEYLFVLAEFLNYRAFDPRDYPLLWNALQLQGIDRAPVREQTFRCRRES